MEQHYDNCLKSLFIALMPISFSYGQSCTNPTLTNINAPTEVCGGKPAILSAETNGDDIYWYDAPASGQLLGIGSTFNTPDLSETTSFWAQAKRQTLGTPGTGGGKALPSGTGGATVGAVNSPWGLLFNATRSFILNSVDIYITDTSAGTLIIELKDTNLNVLETRTIATPPGALGAERVQFTVPLNMNVPVGNGHRLVAVSGPQMVRDLSGSNSFPYPIGNVGSIRQGTINNLTNSNASTYYFFFNWSYTQTANCESAREEVVVNVHSPLAPLGDTSQFFNTGDTIANLEISGSNILWYADAGATISIPTTTPLENGMTYYATQNENGCESEALAITVTQNLGMKNKELAHLKFYPNPVQSQLRISNSDTISNIEIFNYLGQKIASKNNINAREFESDFTGFPSGTYILKVTSGGTTKAVRILKN